MRNTSRNRSRQRLNTNQSTMAASVLLCHSRSPAVLPVSTLSEGVGSSPSYILDRGSSPWEGNCRNQAISQPPANLHRQLGRAFQNETTFSDKNRMRQSAPRVGLCCGHPAIIATRIGSDPESSLANPNLPHSFEPHVVRVIWSTMMPFL